MGSIIGTTFENIAKAVKEDKRFSYPDFGTFTIRKRKARTGRNPQTGEKLMIKASETVGFKPAPGLKGFLEIQTDALTRYQKRLNPCLQFLRHSGCGINTRGIGGRMQSTRFTLSEIPLVRKLGNKTQPIFI